MVLPLKIGSRGSRLAKIQVQEILSLLGASGLGGTLSQHELLTFTTKGDVDKTTPLTTNPADNFFTDSLDEALLKKQIDIAIHSAKDLPQKLPEGLNIFALTKSLDETDSWVSSYTLEDLPAHAKIGTSSLLRAQMMKALKPDVELVDIRGSIEERLDLMHQGKIDGLIIATCALKRLGLEKHIKSILPWESMPLQGQLAVVGRQEDVELQQWFACLDVRRDYGQVFLVGAGPGDAGLITVKAIEILKRCDCVFYDYLIDVSLLKHALQAQHIYVGKRKGAHTLSQEQLCKQLKEKALQGQCVVRLKGGDPLIFGRGADEITYLSSYHIPVQIIPGVSSATGIPSSLGIPLTARGISSSVAFVSGHEESPGSLSENILIPQAQTVIFLMGLTKLNQIVRSLLDNGWKKSKPIMIICNGTKSNETILQGTLANIENLAHSRSLEPPALIIVGDTVNFYGKGQARTFLHCGTHPQEYAYLGRMIPWPMIHIQAMHLSDGQQQNFIKDFERSDWIILTSPAAVEHFMNIILIFKPLEIVRDKIYAVIGRFTAKALEEQGLTPHIQAGQETAEGLFDTIKRIAYFKGKTILFPRSSLPNPFLKQALEKEGASVHEWSIYENIKPPKRPLPDEPIDGVIFTSPSTVKNFLEDYQTIPSHWEILAKGPVTQAALKEAGYGDRSTTITF